MNSNIFNLSNYSLSANELDLLSLPKTFIPYLGKVNFKRLLSEYKHFFIKLKHKLNYRLKFSSLIPTKKKFCLKRNLSDLPLQLFNSHNCQVLLKIKRTIHKLKYHKSSWCPKVISTQLAAIHSLTNNKNIVITPADKGSAWVILNRSDYIKEAMRQLTNTDYYKPCTTPLHNNNFINICSILRDMLRKKYITADEFKYFLPHDNYKKRFFYLLPKIHKNPSCFFDNIPPGRPIVSNCDTETSKISELIDFYLQPLACKTFSYIMDTDHFITFLDNITYDSNNMYLFTLDVKDLYTNIDPLKGISAVSHYFFKYPNDNRPDNHIISLLKLCLCNNDFEFNSSFFQQTKGTAMGVKFAPAYANIYLSIWEHNIFNNNNSNFLPSLWLRYLDDIFGIWPFSIDSFYSFINFVNSIDSDIQVTFNIHNDSINFLDINIFHHDNSLFYRIFIKDSDSFLTLPPNSYHPRHTPKNVILSHFIRYIKRNSFKTDFDNICRLSSNIWRSQGFTRTCISYLKRKALKICGVNNNIFKLGFFKCERVFCSYCIYAIPQSFININDNYRIRICKFLNCNSKNCIYTIFCKLCSTYVYVGESCNFLRLRISSHLGDIKNNRRTPVSKHFNSSGHSIKHFSFTAINSHSSVATRRKLEAKYIHIFNLSKSLININHHCNSNLYCINHYSYISSSLNHIIKTLCNKLNINFSPAYTVDRNLFSLLRSKI